MKKIVIMNSKGGCGKTTIATNLASYYMTQGLRPALFDYDAQGSSMAWLKLRRQADPHDAIHGVAAFQNPAAQVTRAWQCRVPPDVKRIIVDTPAGLTGHGLARHVQGSDVILVPVLPSPIDMQATADFIRDLLLTGHARTQNTRIGIIANRARSNTHAYRKLECFLQRLDIPLVARLRDTQHYLRAAEQGSGITQSKDPTAQNDRLAWQIITAWLENRPVATDTASVDVARADAAVKVP